MSNMYKKFISLFDHPFAMLFLTLAFMHAMYFIVYLTVWIISMEVPTYHTNVLDRLIIGFVPSIPALLAAALLLNRRR